MNREILFRGKRVDNGEWVYGSLLIEKYNCFITPLIDYTRQAFNHISVIPETVGQFTGLTDKNGSKIFEWDKTDGGEIVVFEDGVFGTTYEGNCQGVSRLSNKRCKYMEMTGNIHNNNQNNP